MVHGRRPLKLSENLLPSWGNSNRFGFCLSLMVANSLFLAYSSPDLGDQTLSVQYCDHGSYLTPRLPRCGTV